MTEWTSLDYVVVDVEGNGGQPPDLVELAVVPISGGAIGEPRSWLVRPERQIRHHATRVHGLTNRDVADAPVFAEIVDQVRAELVADVVVAHNAHVDMGVLRRKLGQWAAPEVFDTLKLAKRLAPGQTRYKLGSLVEAFGLADGLPHGLSPHRATYDALVTARLFLRLAAGRSLEELRGHESGGGGGETAALF